jgi:hypothetical protein
MLIMKTKHWVPMMILPLAMAAIVTTSDAQGKGKGQGGDKGGQGQARGADKGGQGQARGADKGGQAEARGGAKPEKIRVATPATTMMAPQRSRSENAGQRRGAENRQMAAERGRSAQHLTGNESHGLRASANASPRANVANAANRGRDIARFDRDLNLSDVRPTMRAHVVSNRAAEFLTGGAVAYAFARGAPENALLIAPTSRDVMVRNRKGDLLLALDDDRARNLGVWEVSPLNDRVTDGAPSFCRSGAGHPVWGRQWCLDKGFGLGAEQNLEWGAARDLGDLVFVRPVNSGILTRDALLNLLGPVAFNRLALHALSLGYTDPLTGSWRSDATGPNLLLVNSGPYPIAELVDGNRDQRADLMLVALRPW